jgi:hypothetical protein
MNSSATHFPESVLGDTTFYSGWAFFHMFFGGAFFIILYKYFGMSVFNASILLLIIHTIYEWKDMHITYNVYDNHPGKMKAAHNFLNRPRQKRPTWLEGVSFPANSYMNSLGDTIFYIAGIALAYYFRDKISPLFVKVLILISVVNWLLWGFLFFYLNSLGLHNKDRVNKIYSTSQMLHSM